MRCNSFQNTQVSSDLLDHRIPFFFLATLWHMEFLGQGLKTCPYHCRNTVDLIVPQWELPQNSFSIDWALRSREGVPTVVQQVKDLVLSSQWRGFDPWPGAVG